MGRWDRKALWRRLGRKDLMLRWGQSHQCPVALRDPMDRLRQYPEGRLDQMDRLGRMVPRRGRLDRRDRMDRLHRLDRMDRWDQLSRHRQEVVIEQGESRRRRCDCRSSS